MSALDLLQKFIPESSTSNLQKIWAGILVTVVNSIAIFSIFFAEEILKQGLRYSSDGFLILIIVGATLYGGANMIMAVYLPKIMYVLAYIVLGSGFLLSYFME